MRELLKVDLDEWRKEIPLIREFFDEFGDKLPAELREALDGLESRIERASGS
jgi:phosphoenolpyruvate carboxykinase (GTP)